MSWRYANGSMSWCLQLPVKEYRTAAVRPLRSLPQKGPIPASDRLGTQHPLGEVIVDAQLPVLGVATERRPVRLRVGDRLTDRALGQHVAALVGQPLLEGRQQRDRIPLTQGATALGREILSGMLNRIELPDAGQRRVRQHRRGGPRLEEGA